MRIPSIFVHTATAVALVALLLAVGQPMFTDDAWWHLIMGEVYAQHGPLLDEDPLLHTAVQPPAPYAWLSDVMFYAASQAAGIQGLRVAHALVVIAILCLAWRLLYRASDSALLGSLGTLLFANLAAYRLVQIRPHLLTILATLVLVRVISDRHDSPSWQRGAFVVALFALWANAHAAFVLGPALLAAAIAGLATARATGSKDHGNDWQPVKRWAVVWVIATAATLLNPEGPTQLFHYFTAGVSTPALEVVGDEWAPLRPFHWPPRNLPPSVLSWSIAWMLLLATPAAILLELRRHRSPPSSAAGSSSTEIDRGLDPAVAGMALLSLVAMVVAVRFLWLGIIPLIALAQWMGTRWPEALRMRGFSQWAWLVAVVSLVTSSFRLGDWPMISQGVHPRVYARPYPAIKYHAHAVWLLADAGLEGNLFNSYFVGNFLGYWLAPGMRAFVNGSLNLPLEAMQASQDLDRRRGSSPDESFGELLDRYGVDVFFGNGIPMLPKPNRPMDFTTTHTESMPGWIPLFRNVQGSISLRNVPRNRENLRKVTAFFEREGVPFDAERGFDVAEVIRESPGWAMEHGILPVNFANLQGAALSSDPMARRAAQNRLASLYLVLGEYERASALDRKILRSDPESAPAARRLVWSLLHQGEFESSRDAAHQLNELHHPADRLNGLIIEVAGRSETFSPDRMRSIVATLPVFTRFEAAHVFAGIREPEARQRRLEGISYSTRGSSFSK